MDTPSCQVLKRWKAMTYNARKYLLAGSWGIYTVCQLSIYTADSVTNRFLEMSTSTGKGRVPWAELQRAWGDYIEAKYLPKDVALKQYNHLRQEDVNTILKHWMWRKADSEVPFLFKKAVKAICQNVYMSDGNSSDSDAEQSEEEQDLQNSNGSWAQGDGQLQGDSGSDPSTEHAHPGQSLDNAAKSLNRVSWQLKYDWQALTSLKF